MKNKYALAAATVCSILVGLCWGANIGSLYPVVEVVLQGESLHQWIDKQIQQSESNAKRIERRIAELHRRRQRARAEDSRGLQKQDSDQQRRLAAERQALARARWLRPYIKRYLPGDAFQTLLLVVLYLFVGTIARNMFLAGNMILVERVGQKTGLELRRRAFEQTLSMEMSAFDQDHTGRLMSHFTTNINLIVEGVKALFGLGFREPLKIAVCIAGAAFVSWRLLLLSFGLFPLVVAAVVLLARTVKAANHHLMRELGQLYRRLAESLTLIRAVQAFTLERLEENRFAKAAEALYRRCMGVVWFNCATRFTSDVLGIGAICLAIVFGGYLVLNRETHLFGIQVTNRPLSAGSLIVFFAFLVGIREPSRKLTEFFNLLHRARAAADQIYPLIDHQAQIAAPAEPRPAPEHLCELQFIQVDFAYRAGQPVLKNVQLQIRKGETLAVVGPSGGGKSTLANLMLRFYDPDRGAILLNGTDLRDFCPRDLRRRIGLVTQQPLLFDDSIRDNIRFGCLQATDEQIHAAARKAHAHAFIEELEQTYEYRVGEGGSRLSGGQRQRIALARAILRDPAILILDEATNQVDSESEALIRLALTEFVRDRITLLITHRLSMLPLADRILVLDAGRAVNLGTHEELIGRCELYRRLYYGDLQKSA